MEQTTEQKYFGVSGSTLKIIAMVTMLIDHIGAAVLIRYILDMPNHAFSMEQYNQWVMLYRVLRGIGRIAFPIYCFLLVEGFQKTRNLGKYFLRLGIFTLAAEVPFDLCFTSQPFSPSHQSVMLTLLIGVATMWVVKQLEKWVQNRVLQVCGTGLAVIVGAAVAELLNTDYGYMGVICIMVLYLLRSNRRLQLIGGCLVFSWEIWAPIAFIPVAFYNGKRGLRLKYVFYLFYPLHLLILYLICVYMGLGDIPAV